MRYSREERDALLAELAEKDPGKYGELVELRKYNPQAYRKQLRDLKRRGIVVGFPDGQVIYNPNNRLSKTSGSSTSKTSAPKKKSKAKKSSKKKSKAKKKT